KYDAFLYFFFQAEDGIRDRNVTGVQTCALPIYGGLQTIFTSVSEISGISAKTIFTWFIICGPSGQPIEVNVISTVHKPSSSTSTLYTKPKFTISIPNSGSITISKAFSMLSFNPSSIHLTSSYLIILTIYQISYKTPIKCYDIHTSFIKFKGDLHEFLFNLFRLRRNTVKR